MEQLMACRICLATDVPLYEMCKYQLKTAYENLTGFHMPDSSVHHVCSYCGTMLNNYSSFKEKCTRSQQVLDMLVKQNLSITPCLIKTIDRYSHKLTLPYTTHYIQNNNSYIIQNVDSAVKMNKFDTPVTSQNYDSVVSLQNFNSLITSQRFSIVTVKEEKSQIKSDNDEYYDYSFDYNNDVENVNSDFNDENYKDAKQKCDSDEEPLAKKIKKKQKKSKVKLHKHSVNLSKYDEVDVKTEDRQHFSINDQNVLTNDQNLPIQNLNLQENIQYLETNHLNVSNQVQDLEIDHKLVILSEQEQIEEVLSRKLSANYLNSVHKCESCFKGFMTEATYKNHMARHEPCAGPVACPVCATRWPDARALRAHTLISHERRYICKVCGHISKSSHKAKEHTQWHAGVTFPCNTCGRSFTKSTSYLTHVRLRHATHVCAACGQSFIGENGLSMHKKKAHRDDHGEPSLYECHSCHVQFRSAAALRQHGELIGDGCDDTLHVCVQCGDHFASDQLLKEHKDMHLKTDALRTCSQCSRTFANERSLAAHVQRAHARTHARSPRHCVCEVCGYKCMSTSSLVNHQRVHSGEKPHACVHCHKRFSVAQRLQIHVRTHTGERPFQCTRCPKAFKHKAALNRHDRVHTGVKPYSCPQCGKSFSQSNSMKQHCAGVHMKTYIYSRRSKQ